MKKAFFLFVCCIFCFWASVSMAGWVSQRVELDSDNNGSIDAVEYYTYDSNGNPIRAAPPLWD